MDDLATFFARHPHLDADTLRRIERYRATAELRVRETVQKVQTRKRSQFNGADMGARLSAEAVRKIEDAVIAFCSRLFTLTAEQYLAVPDLAGDLTAMFEALVGAVLVESSRMYRNATAGMWFERTPSLSDLRLRKEQGSTVPVKEIADYSNPEPFSIRVGDLLVGRMEPVREAVTVEAMRKRVERLKPEPEQTAQEQEPATVDGMADQGTEGEPRANRKRVDDFLQRLDAYLREHSDNGIKKATRKVIWEAAGHTTARQFEHWQGGNDKATASDRETFPKLLNLSPVEFIAEWKKKQNYK